MDNLKDDLNNDEKNKEKYLIYFKEILILIEELIKSKNKLKNKEKFDDEVKNFTSKIIEDVLQVSHKNNMEFEIYDCLDEMSDNEFFFQYLKIAKVFRDYKIITQQFSLLNSNISNISNNHNFSNNELYQSLSSIIFDCEKFFKDLSKK